MINKILASLTTEAVRSKSYAYEKKSKTCPNEKVRKEHKYSLVKYKAKNYLEVELGKNINKY